MVTIAVPHAWAISTLRQRTWMSHVLIAGTWRSRCCVPDTSSPNEGVSPLPCPVHGQGDFRITVRASLSSTSLRASHSSSASHRLVFPDKLAGSSDRAGPSISFGAPADDRMSIAASGDELGSGDADSAALPPSGRVALPESDPELTAMLSRAAESVGLHWRAPPSPERSRLDDWFMGAQADLRQPPPVLFFKEVHEEVTRSWRAHFVPKTGLVPPSSSPPSTVEWPKGMWRARYCHAALPARRHRLEG